MKLSPAGEWSAGQARAGLQDCPHCGGSADSLWKLWRLENIEGDILELERRCGADPDPPVWPRKPLPIPLLLDVGRNQMQDQFSNRDFVKSGGMFFLQIPRFRLFKFHSNWESSGYWEHDTADKCGGAAREME